MTPLATELQQLADDIAARHRARERVPAEQLGLRSLPPLRPLTTCVLCGDPSWVQVCEHCAATYERLGV